MVANGDRYRTLAYDNEVRQRKIAAERGLIYDRNGIVLADNQRVYTVSVIPNQVVDKEKTIEVLHLVLEKDEEEVRKRVCKRSSIEIIKTGVDVNKASELGKYELPGVKVDIDYKRYYPYPEIASRILGFTGKDNQGVVGLESYYNNVLTGTAGNIYTYTDARGIELSSLPESIRGADKGNSIITTIDANIQSCVCQTAREVLESTQAQTVSIVVMNPDNGEILAMTTAPEYNNQQPFADLAGNNLTDMNQLNKMWRIPFISDGFEPGSTFKIVTATAALSEKVCSLTDTFSCGGVKQVGGRSIHCHKRTGHGALNFTEALKQSCNVALMNIGERLGAEKFYKYFERLGLLEKTGIDIAGEGRSIVHKLDSIGEVELATMSFGQTFQVTPIQHLRAISCCINGGKLITPHFLKAVGDFNLINTVESQFNTEENVIDPEVSATMRDILFQVVEDGTGKNAKVDGFRIAGKTATSEKLPRGNGKYIASFVGFAPYDNPQVLVFVMIDEPVGPYYGGVIAAPVAGNIFKQILPYVGINE